MKLGLPLPKAVQNMPELGMGLEFYWDAFMDLTTCRGGMGDGPISWLVAYQYAKHLRLDEEEFEDLWHLLSEMDHAWMKYQKRKQG